MDIVYNGNTYTITGDAYLSCRLFAGGFSDAEDGDSYIVEFYEPAEDADGNQVRLVWHFEAVMGDEPADDEFAWEDTENIVDII